MDEVHPRLTMTLLSYRLLVRCCCNSRLVDTRTFAPGLPSCIGAATTLKLLKLRGMAPGPWPVIGPLLERGVPMPELGALCLRCVFFGKGLAGGVNSRDMLLVLDRAPCWSS